MYRRNILITVGLGATLGAVGGLYIFQSDERRELLVPAAADQAPAGPLDMTVEEGEHILGDVNAPLTMIEYASLTCPHCAAFHTQTLPELKTNWIDTGKLRLVYRHYPLNGPAFVAAAMTECAPASSFFPLINTLFETQRAWGAAENPMAELQRLAGFAGIDEETFNRCTSDEDALNALIEKRSAYTTLHDVQATPTLVLEGRKLEGERSYQDINDLLIDLAG